MSLKQHITKLAREVYGPKAWYVEKLGHDLDLHGMVIVEGKDKDKAEIHVVFKASQTESGRRKVLELLYDMRPGPVRKVKDFVKSHFGRLVSAIRR